VAIRSPKGFLEFFPAEENYRLWILLIQRTLEHFGIETEEKHREAEAWPLLLYLIRM
jgi:hypothetical protein